MVKCQYLETAITINTKLLQKKLQNVG